MPGGGPFGSGQLKPQRKKAPRRSVGGAIAQGVHEARQQPRKRVGKAVQQQAQHKVSKRLVKPPRGEKGRHAEQIVRAGHEVKASPKQQLSALATSLVETKLRNLPSKVSDRDSAGLFQQRPSQGWGSEKQVLNPNYAAKRYYRAAKEIDYKGLPAHELAAQVQRPAAEYRDRYRLAIPAARRLLQRGRFN